jgi:hypothetical protein
MTCTDCGKPLDDHVCETDLPRPGRKTVRYTGRLCERCFEKRVGASKNVKGRGEDAPGCSVK